MLLIIYIRSAYNLPILLNTSIPFSLQIAPVTRPKIKDQDQIIERIAVTCDPTVLKYPVRCKLDDPTTCLECKENDYTCQHVRTPFKIQLSDGQESDWIPANNNPNEGYCLKLEGRTRKCNQKTGMWLLTRTNLVSQSFYFLCKCRYPGLVTQRTAFDDCDVCVQCPLESLDVNPLLQGRCKCDPVFEVSEWSPVKGPFCRPKLFREAMEENIMPFNLPTFKEFSSQYPPQIFNRKWLSAYGSTIVSRRPCSYDVETGKSLLGDNRLAVKNGPKVHGQCLCDSSFGNIPVYGSEVGDTGFFAHYSVQGGRIPVGCTSVFRNGFGNIKNAYERIHYYKKDQSPEVDLVLEVEDKSNLKPRFANTEGVLVFRLDWPTNALNVLADEKLNTELVTPVLSCRKTFKWLKITAGLRLWESVTCLPSTSEECWNRPAENVTIDMVSQDGLYNKPKRWKDCPQQFRKRKGLFLCNETYDETPPSKVAKVDKDCKKCLYWTDTKLPEIFQTYNVPACLYKNNQFLKMYYSNVIPPPLLPEVGDVYDIPEVYNSDIGLDKKEWYSIQMINNGAAPILIYDFMSKKVSIAETVKHNVLSLKERKANIGSLPVGDLTDVKGLAGKIDIDSENWFT